MNYTKKEHIKRLKEWVVNLNERCDKLERASAKMYYYEAQLKNKQYISGYLVESPFGLMSYGFWHKAEFGDLDYFKKWVKNNWNFKLTIVEL